MASASASTCSESYSDLLKPREQSRARSMPPCPGQHKRVDSIDLKEAGALFQQNGKQSSWPRPPKIDIPIEEGSTTEPVLSEVIPGLHRLPTIRPGPNRRHLSNIEPHLVSAIDLASIREQRDRLASRAKGQTHSSENSQDFDSDGAASTIDDEDIQGHRTPTRDLPTHIESSRPNTPPPPSVINTEDEQYDDTVGPVSPHPWTQYNEKKRKRSDNGDEDEEQS
ncbi:hypothetical protein FB567DRAFT_598713 [Paraphoma chrysanthemicola]|uniref:Uncharacterized protein n=1 Tax=Paraphoma chrysanthemicola TaxID=798071 RepID=A0A8K0QSZ1_9PLEO|nr:hypothetical protein FB567DRAFT_598713 [Paraphoma chrysanthemicola]